MNSRKKIMLFTDWYEPGFKAGGPIRSCVNFAARMKEDYNIYVFTGDRDLGDEKPYPQISPNEWIEKEGLYLFYAAPAVLNWENMLVQIQRVKPDYLYLNNMYSRYFTIYPLLFKKLGLVKASVVLAPRGMLKASAVQFKAGKKKIFLRLLKLLRIHRAITFHATDNTEAADIRNYFGDQVRIAQITNFPPQQQALQPIAKAATEVKVIFSGRIHPIKNLLFVLRCLPAVTGKLRLSVVGAVEDKAYWEECKSVIQSLPEQVSIEFYTSVAHTALEQLTLGHHLFVLPTLGENFGHAIFEALSTGRPVLISDQTPWRNLPAAHAGWDLPLSDPSAFVQVLQQVADMDDEAYQQWSTGAWQYAKNFTEHSNLKEKYKELFS